MNMSTNKFFMMIFLSFLLALAGCQKDDSGNKPGQSTTPGTERSGTGMGTTQGSGSSSTGQSDTATGGGTANPDRTGDTGTSTGGTSTGGADTGTGGTGTGSAGTSTGDTITGGTGAAMEKAGDYMDDSVITAKIKQDILSDPLLKASQIDVTTENGVVKLTGTVDSQQSVDRIKALAQSITDVKAVESELVVKENTK
jgi:hyperosmotically inducible protein